LTTSEKDRNFQLSNRNSVLEMCFYILDRRNRVSMDYDSSVYSVMNGGTVLRKDRFKSRNSV